MSDTLKRYADLADILSADKNIDDWVLREIIKPEKVDQGGNIFMVGALIFSPQTEKEKEISNMRMRAHAK